MTGDQALKLGNSILSVLAVTNPSTVAGVTAVRGLIVLVNEILVPEFKELFRKGEISAADQAKVFSEFENFRNNFDEQFSGPEWQQD